MSIKIIIINILILGCTLIALSWLIFPEPTVPIVGENQFSFSYLGHISWIIQDWINQPKILLQSHECFDCQNFGMYSRGVMVWLYLFFLPGELFKINPLIWYAFISFFLQYGAIAYFL